MGKPHFSTPWVHAGLTAEDLKRAAIAYRHKSGDCTRGRTALFPSTFARAMTAFYDKNIYPLNLHFAQTLRVMLMTHFLIGEKWANPGACSDTSYR